MKIGIDIDNTITASEESLKFFQILTASFTHAPVEIYIITNRDPGTEKEVEQELQDLGICWDHLKITADKADYIIQEGITVYYDDTDEYFLSLPKSVCVFKIREEGNFDFNGNNKWLYGNKTGINVDKRELV